jgi:hypothetical protein
VALISWIGTPLLLMIDTAVWRPSWACQWPMPALRVIDDQLFVNTHIYGVMANNAPFFHLRKIPGGAMAVNYFDSFEHVWTEAVPLSEGDEREP